MGLILPSGPSFAHWSDNLVASADGLDYGTGVAVGASANAAGTAVTLLSALAHDCEYLVLGVSGYSGSGVNGSTLVDILIDPAGGTSWSDLISDLLCGFTAFMELDGSGALGAPLMYHFPIWLKAGTSIGAVAQGTFLNGSSVFTAPANTPRIVAYAAGGNKNPASWWCGQKVETVGTLDTANSRGQAHTAGASGAFSSWTSLGSAIGARAGALQYGVQGPGSSSASGKVYRFEFGAGSNQIGPCLYKGLGGLEVSTSFFPGPVFCDIAAGTQMQVRAACGTTSPQALDCAAYLVQ